MKIYKTNRFLYISLLILSILLSSSIFFFSMSNAWFTIVTGIGCGAFASVLVAWLIDIANCNVNNLHSAAIRKRYFFQLRISYANLLLLFRTRLGPSIQKGMSWSEQLYACAPSWSEDEIESICEDISVLENIIRGIANDALLIEALHILPENEIAMLIHIKTDLQYIKHILKHDRIDPDQFRNLFNAFIQESRKSCLLSEILQHSYTAPDNLLVFTQNLDR